MDVGVRELKEHLSAYLDQAAKGEVIRITDRGVPKAILAPLPGRLRLEEGVARGWIRAGAGASAGAGLGPVRRARPSRSTAAVLREDRSE